MLADSLYNEDERFEAAKLATMVEASSIGAAFDAERTEDWFRITIGESVGIINALCGPEETMRRIQALALREHERRQQADHR